MGKQYLTGSKRGFKIYVTLRKIWVNIAIQRKKRRLMFKYNQCTPEELEYIYPIDKYVRKESFLLYRAISIDAPAETVFAWVTQLRFAPYSYDWIDNFGRQSPQHLIVDAPPLKTGDPIMRWFRLTEFKDNESLTFVFPEDAPFYLRIFFNPFPFYATYQLFRVSNNRTRLVVKFVINSHPTLLNRILIKVADVLDYIMMRRQLLNFKRLAEPG